MPGDADMSYNEMVGRIATLEALVLRLCELEARRRDEKDGRPGIDGFAHSLVEAVHLRTQGSPELQKQFVSAHLDQILHAIGTMLEPDDRAKN